MGACGGTKEKRNPEEEEKKKDEQDKSKSKEISKEKDQKKKPDLKSNKDEKLTNPIINQNNLQPSKENTLINQIPQQNQNKEQNQNKNELEKIFSQNNAQLPSAINSIKINDGTSSIFPVNLNQKKQNKNIKSSAPSENIENEQSKSQLLKNEHLIAPMEGQLFPKTMTDNQLKNLENYNNNFYPKGEHILLSFGDSFDIFNTFFTTLFSEHQLYKEQPIYNYNTFFENEDNYNYKARGIAFNIPNDYYELYLKSEINTLYNNSNIIFNSSKKSKTNVDMNAMNTLTLKQFLNLNEKYDDFIKKFNNY